MPQAWFAYDYEARCAWLDDTETLVADASHQWPLCARHADSMKVPRGWFCVDRRAERPDGGDDGDGSAGALGRPGPGAEPGARAVPTAAPRALSASAAGTPAPDQEQHLSAIL